MATYKTRNTGMENGMQGTQGGRERLTRISENLLEDSAECYHFNIPWDIQIVSREYSRRFWEMFQKTSGNV